MNIVRIATLLSAVLILAGCAGTTSDYQSIMALSTPEVLDPEVHYADLENLKLPEQSPINVKVFEQRPEFAYFVIESFETEFRYDTNSMKSKKKAKEDHINKLRVRAGQRGANGLIVAWSLRKENDSSPSTRGSMAGASATANVPRTTKVYVTCYYIYRRVN